MAASSAASPKATSLALTTIVCTARFLCSLWVCFRLPCSQMDARHTSCTIVFYLLLSTMFPGFAEWMSHHTGTLLHDPRLPCSQMVSLWVARHPYQMDASPQTLHKFLFLSCSHFHIEMQISFGISINSLVRSYLTTDLPETSSARLTTITIAISKNAKMKVMSSTTTLP